MYAWYVHAYAPVYIWVCKCEFTLSIYTDCALSYIQRQHLLAEPKADWWANVASQHVQGFHAPAKSWDYKQVAIFMLDLFMWMLGFNLKYSHLCCKSFLHWAINLTYFHLLPVNEQSHGWSDPISKPYSIAEGWLEPYYQGPLIVLSSTPLNWLWHRSQQVPSSLLNLRMSTCM